MIFFLLKSTTFSPSECKSKPSTLMSLTYSPAGSCTKTCLVPWWCWAQFSLIHRTRSSSSTRFSFSLLDSIDSDSWSFSTTGRFGEETHKQTAPRFEWKSGPVRSVYVQHAEFLDSVRTEWEPEPSALKLHSCGCSASVLEAADSGHSRSLKSLLFDKAYIEGWLRLAHS